MIIPCFRCSKEIDTPGSSSADYVIADDMIVKEPKEVLVALKHNQATLAKRAKMEELNPDGAPKYPDLAIDDSEYDAIEIPNFGAGKAFGETLVKVVVKVKEKDIQKTGIICPECYRKTDFVIWGVHKARVEKPEKK